MDRYGRKLQFDVKRSVYIANVFYLFYYGGKACLFPFLTLYFRQLGLTASQTGLAIGIKAIVWFFVSPIWMTLIHRVNKTRAFLCYSIFIMIGSNLSLSLLPPADPMLPVQFCLNESPPLLGPVVGNHVPTILPMTMLPINHDITTASRNLAPNNVQQTYATEKLDVSSTAAFTTTSVGQNATETALPSTVSHTHADSVKSVASTKPVTSTPPVKVYQIAKSMVPAFKNTGVTSDQEDIIKKFISEYDVTKDLSDESKEKILRRVIRFLTDEKNKGSKHSSNRRSARRGSWLGSRDWFRGKHKRSASNDNETTSNSIYNAMKNFTSILSVKKDEAIESLTPFVTANSYLFLCVVIILIAGELLSAPVEMVSDNSLYCLLDELDNLNQYGKHRTSALVGAALGGISVSIIVYLSPCLINGSINRHFLLLITVLIVGITQAPMQNFMFWMVQDMEGSSELVYGSFVSVNAICSMISSLVGRRINKLMKPCSAAMMSLLSIAMQLVLYAFTPNPWIILPLQLLNITGLSFLWTIVTHHTSTTMSSAYEKSERISSVHVFARASQQRSLHATYVSVYQGLAFGFGSLLSGFLYDYLEGNMMPVLVGSGILVSAWGVIFVMYQCCCLPRKLQRKYSHLLSDSDSDVNLAESRELSKKYKERNGTYSSVDDSRRKKRKDRKKIQRFHTTIDTETSESDENDWLKATMKKESRML